MNGRIAIILGLILSMITISCTSDDKKTAPAGKSDDEKKFEARVAELIQKKVNLDEERDRDIPILYWAVKYNYVDAVRMLLEGGANPNIAPKNGSKSTVLFGTIFSITFGDDPSDRQRLEKSRAIAELLIKHGANVKHTVGKMMDTPLHQAALRGRVDLCEMFIKKGANPNAADVLGTTPLHEAAKEGYWEACACLLKNRAQVNVKNQLGETPLSLANKRTDEADLKKFRKKNNETFQPGIDFDKTIEVLKKHGAK